MEAYKMSLCECGCKIELTGRQKRFRPGHGEKWWSFVRKIGAAEIKGQEHLPLAPAVAAPRDTGKPHSGHPGRSKRLAKTLNAVMDLRKFTTLELQARTGGMKVSTDIDDLRRAGYPISMAKYLRTTEEGRKVFEYEWLG